MSRYSFLMIVLIAFVSACSSAPTPALIAQASATAQPTCMPTPTSTPFRTPTATPTAPGPGTPWPTIKPGTLAFATVTPIPFSKTTDLAPGLPDSSKLRAVVYRCNGSYELFLLPPSQRSDTITDTVKLGPGDVVVSLYAPFVGKNPSSYPPRPPSPPPIETRVISLKEAQQQASFHLFVPTYLPSGFRLVSVTRWGAPQGVPTQNRFYLHYVGRARGGRPIASFLNISEEPWTPPPASIPIPSTPFGLTPPPQVTVHGVSVYVDRNLCSEYFETPELPNECYFALHWAESNVFLTVTGSLGLDELTKIAESLQ